ncbi:hypothetical protein [Aquisphaera insulae]|uniref:hypothetical protein n=1 Tax=Aquisphaera insulae TaxID=2712864 RepID=UPI0013ED3C42|nr:hypothetical protein [Aquisphaera insulae]
MSLSSPRRIVRVLIARKGLVAFAAMLIVTVAYGMRDTRRESCRFSGPSISNELGSSSTVPARLEALAAGQRIPADAPPPGWSQLVSKSIPKLETGDLDTVSDQAYVVAARIRPVIAAEVAGEIDGNSSAYHLVRVGMGLCAPAVAEGEDVVVTSSKVEGTRGEWTTKERIILTAMAYETSKATLVAATPTFALIRTPVNSLVEGKHRTLDCYHAILADRRTGDVRAIVWQDRPAAARDTPGAIPARLMTTPAFSCPMDVHATKLPGNIPVAWSFAIRGLPPGQDIELPRAILDLIRRGEADERTAAEFEAGLTSATDEERSLATDEYR